MTVEAQAVEPGTASNAAVGAVTVMVTPPAGIETVTNESPFTGGADGENTRNCENGFCKAMPRYQMVPTRNFTDPTPYNMRESGRLA